MRCEVMEWPAGDRSVRRDDADLAEIRRHLGEGRDPGLYMPSSLETRIRMVAARARNYTRRPPANDVSLECVSR
jgi:hypothetical protein